jgi:hypothetical protein
MRCDTIPMPVENLLDWLARKVGYAPFKCRACRAKFYRRSHAVTANPPPVAECPPEQSVQVSQKDRADTLRRLENIIRTAEVRRLRRG